MTARKDLGFAPRGAVIGSPWRVDPAANQAARDDIAAAAEHELRERRRQSAMAVASRAGAMERVPADAQWARPDPTPAEAGQAWVERSVEQQRHNAVCHRLETIERLLVALAVRFNVEVPL